MTIYTAPVEEMMFLFDNLKDNQRYNEIEKYKEINSELVKGILEEAAKINQNLILPLAKAGDENLAVLENGVVRTPPGYNCLLYTSPSPRDRQKSRMPSSA